MDKKGQGSGFINFLHSKQTCITLALNTWDWVRGSVAKKEEGQTLPMPPTFIFQCKLQIAQKYKNCA